MNPRHEAGEIVWVDFDPTVGHEQRGHRPAVIISEPMGGLIIVVPMTTTVPKMRTHVALAGRPGGVSSTAMAEQVRTIDVRRVTKVAGRVSLAELDAIRNLVAILIGR